jgi:hypothetical protein
VFLHECEVTVSSAQQQNQQKPQQQQDHGQDSVLTPVQVDKGAAQRSGYIFSTSWVTAKGVSLPELGWLCCLHCRLLRGAGTGAAGVRNS